MPLLLFPPSLKKFNSPFFLRKFSSSFLFSLSISFSQLRAPLSCVFPPSPFKLIFSPHLWLKRIFPPPCDLPASLPPFPPMEMTPKAGPMSPCRAALPRRTEELFFFPICPHRSFRCLSSPSRFPELFEDDVPFQFPFFFFLLIKHVHFLSPSSFFPIIVFVVLLFDPSFSDG